MSLPVTEPPAADVVDEAAELAQELLEQQKLVTISQLASGIAYEVNTPAQYVIDNVSFLQRAFDKLLKLVEAQASVLDEARRGAVNPLTLEAADAARRQLKLDYLARQVPRAIEQSMQGLGQLSSLAKAMKDFSHSSGNEKQPTDLHDVIESTSVVTRNEWRYVADLELDFDWSLPPVPLHRNDFAQVVLNLIVNAAHAIADALPPARAEKGRIVISTRGVGQQVELRVSDNGTGIPEAARPRVFEPFFSTKPAGKGNGHGLAIARAVVVDKHEGSIEFETAVGGGTTFIVRLPFAIS